MSALGLGTAAARVAMVRRMVAVAFILLVMLVLSVLLCCLDAFPLSVAGNQRGSKAKGGHVFIHEQSAPTIVCSRIDRLRV
jgi:hypothetical protein